MNKMIFVFIMTGLAVWVSVPFASPAQEYELVAEWGRQGSGDGEFADIRGLAVDAYGNVYTEIHFQRCLCQEMGSPRWQVESSFLWRCRGPLWQRIRDRRLAYMEVHIPGHPAKAMGHARGQT